MDFRALGLCEKCFPVYPINSSDDKESTGFVIYSLVLAVLRVLINITHENGRRLVILCSFLEKYLSLFTVFVWEVIASLLIFEKILLRVTFPLISERTHWDKLFMFLGKGFYWKSNFWLIFSWRECLNFVLLNYVLNFYRKKCY